jgi:hypothetical protein
MVIFGKDLNLTGFQTKMGPKNSSQLCEGHGFKPEKMEYMENRTPESRESLWRRKLSDAERAGLRGQPDLEQEARLTDALAQMRNVPVPSNFTARVMDAIELEDARSARLEQSKGWRWNWRMLLPRVAVTAAVLLFGALVLQYHQTGLHRAEMAKSLSVVASAQAVPDVDALNNFDTIQRMSQSGRADNELLVALQ